jgi:hypothetical protein
VAGNRLRMARWPSLIRGGRADRLRVIPGLGGKRTPGRTIRRLFLGAWRRVGGFSGVPGGFLPTGLVDGPGGAAGPKNAVPLNC